jgi:hypothetical protein
LADVMKAKLFVDRGVGTTPVLYAGEAYEDIVLFRLSGQNGEGRHGHFNRVVQKAVGADVVVRVRGQGNCAYLAAATKTKRSLQNCDRNEFGVPTSAQNKRAEDEEGARLRACVADLLGDEGNWECIHETGASLYK